MNIFDQIFRDKQGKIVIFQVPNVPLVVWGVATVATHFLRGDFASITSLMALLAIITWSAIELWSGSSLFRRILGGVILVLVLIKRI